MMTVMRAFSEQKPPDRGRFMSGKEVGQTNIRSISGEMCRMWFILE